MENLSIRDKRYNQSKLVSTKAGKIMAISVSKRRGIPKTNVSSAKIIENYGIEGDAHAGNWHRQVSLLPVESLNKMRNAGLPKLRPGAVAENLTIEGIEWNEFPVGSKIKIGKFVLLEVTQIGKECHDKCSIFLKIGDCVLPREGIFARVIKGGKINTGDIITVLQQNNKQV